MALVATQPTTTRADSPRVRVEVEQVTTERWQIVFVRVGGFELRVYADERAPRDGLVEAEAELTFDGRVIAWPEWGEA